MKKEKYKIERYDFNEQSYYKALLLVVNKKYPNGIEKIPFIKINNEFESIAKYCNEVLSTLSYKEIQMVLKKYPQLGIGLDPRGKIKSSEIMLIEYLKNEINLNNRIVTLEELDREQIKNIYIYLLIPNMTPETYDKLCENIYIGEEKTNKLLNHIQQKIEKKREEYIKIASELGLKNELIASVEFLDNCENIIDDCLKKEKTKTRGRK